MTRHAANAAQLGLALEPSRRLKPSAVKVYDLLKAAGPRGVTSGEFIRAYVERFSARILELRQLGLEIRTERIEGRAQSRYTLRGPGGAA